MVVDLLAVIHPTLLHLMAGILCHVETIERGIVHGEETEIETSSEVKYQKLSRLLKR